MEPHVETEQRILNAAGEVFAERGFRDATVREICARAGANLAAINYHFGDKAALYGRVLDQARCWSDEHDRPILDAAGTPQDRLELFIRGMLNKLFDKGRPSWHTRLMSREMVEPTAAFDGLVDCTIRPKFDLLRGIVADLLGPPAPDPEDDRVILSAASVIGQCLHHHHCRHVTHRLLPGALDAPDLIPKLTDHILRFSLAGIAGLRQPGTTGAGRAAGGDR
ncbi:MAG: CerR family C-terminal domain-containing protein [Phycisphaeraceae bacterium]|nr:MAG: CerR family C-terminal domain-containing protein [Phycisphaeraceae bacterium]